MIFSLPLNEVIADRLEALKADGTRESRHLVETLPGAIEDDKKEFPADATSFANAAGGDLIYGVRERRDTARKPTGEIEEIVGLPNLSFDAERLRLENVLRDGVAPRLSPVAFHLIPRDPAPPCLLVRIPRGWAGLHMIISKNWSRFYSRNSGGKYQLDVNEIRAGFLAAETAYDGFGASGLNELRGPWLLRHQLLLVMASSSSCIPFLSMRQGKSGHACAL